MSDKRVGLVKIQDWTCSDGPLSAPPPIFLIHDGGGTLDAYRRLGCLRRVVYGIPNPYFFCASSAAQDWDLVHMARLYARWIRNVVSSDGDLSSNKKVNGPVDITLGGWSLGGLMSLQVAKELEDDSLVCVAGILMVDSPYPHGPGIRYHALGHLCSLKEGATMHEALSMKCLIESFRMLPMWRPPFVQEKATNKWPRIALVRATGYLPTRDDTVSPVDCYRHDDFLGWRFEDMGMLQAVVHVEGHHFNIFSPSRILATTAGIQNALAKLDDAILRRGRIAAWNKL